MSADVGAPGNGLPGHRDFGILKGGSLLGSHGSSISMVLSSKSLGAFLVRVVLNPAGVGRSPYPSLPIGRRGTRILFPLLLSIPTYFSKLVANSSLVTAIFGS